MPENSLLKAESDHFAELIYYLGSTVNPSKGGHEIGQTEPQEALKNIYDYFNALTQTDGELKALTALSNGFHQDIPITWDEEHILVL